MKIKETKGIIAFFFHLLIQSDKVKWDGVLKLTVILILLAFIITVFYQINLSSKNFCIGICQFENYNSP